ncbi:hypothetical protein J3A84_06195 [Proteiniclasticum sp. SCR006]|uniref:Uncharacterized protein n=1 Tax=Proteiniclasticum aestuarii TaxID=2817862 RepID=A0A939KKD9_9CLOT|nr:hypothetical protein [Proteiniclasticum aestuarii]MBO1264615.1 hypothetical protein [Proteiniclasticum aestuarii]
MLFFAGAERLLKNIYQKPLYSDTPLWYYLNIPGGGMKLPPVFKAYKQPIDEKEG